MHVRTRSFCLASDPAAGFWNRFRVLFTNLIWRKELAVERSEKWMEMVWNGNSAVTWKDLLFLTVIFVKSTPVAGLLRLPQQQWSAAKKMCCATPARAEKLMPCPYAKICHGTVSADKRLRVRSRMGIKHGQTWSAVICFDWIQYSPGHSIFSQVQPSCYFAVGSPWFVPLAPYALCHKLMHVVMQRCSMSRGKQKSLWALRCTMLPITIYASRIHNNAIHTCILMR